ncbi:hypothetical protein D3C76_1718730 [compost metagenome]
MLLYTKKANNVFGFVYDFFGEGDISSVRTPSRASHAPTGFVSFADPVNVENPVGAGLARDD